MKSPTAIPFGEIQFQAGSYDRLQGNLDLGGPVVGNEQFSYRLTGLVRDAKDWFPGGKDNRTYIAPAITWQPYADTLVTVLAEHSTANITANSAYFSDAATCQLINTFNIDPAYSTAFIEQYVDAATDHEGVAEPENLVAVGGLRRGAIAGRLSLGRVDRAVGDLVDVGNRLPVEAAAQATNGPILRPHLWMARSSPGRQAGQSC